jgi:DNA-binding response OmpR family regulator
MRFTNEQSKFARLRLPGSLERYFSGVVILTGKDSPGNAPLNGLRVLIVEDETLVAMLVEEYLIELGCVVAGSARRIGKALEALEQSELDAAILDLNVAGENILPLAEALDARGVPFLFASGYGAKGVDPRWAHLPVLQKPFTITELEKALLALKTKSV